MKNFEIVAEDSTQSAVRRRRSWSTGTESFAARRDSQVALQALSLHKLTEEMRIISIFVFGDSLTLADIKTYFNNSSISYN